MPGRYWLVAVNYGTSSRGYIYLNVVIIIDIVLTTALKNSREKYISLRKMTLFCLFSEHENPLSFPPPHHFVHTSEDFLPSIRFNANNLVDLDFSYFYTICKLTMLLESTLVFPVTFLIPSASTTTVNSIDFVQILHCIKQMC